MNFFDTGLMLALAICIIGSLYRIVRWGGDGSTDAESRTDNSSWLLVAGRTAKVAVSEVVGLSRSLRTSPLRWIAHCLVFFGFMGLLLFHALDDTITVSFFPAYESTLDPWQFLRNLFGLMTLVGLGIMIYRRAASNRLRQISQFQDWAAILLVGCIILSGFLLEASKIISPTVFDRMTEEYFYPEETGDTTALKAYWAHKYGVVFNERLSMSESVLERGAVLDEESCVDCHADTKTAFVSRSLATVAGPLAPALNRSGADEVFWYFHILFCFIGLALLPYGKFFHPLTTPANLLVRQGRRDGKGSSTSTAQGLGIDACTRCGECSVRCSVAPSFSVLGNADVLPSEKLVSLARFRAGEMQSDDELHSFAEGSRICTECLRCTDICPAGINLQELWLDSKPRIEGLAPDANDTIRTMNAEEWGAAYGTAHGVPTTLGLADKAESFWDCVQCTTCTSVCPVVAVSDDPSRDLDLLPQQIMNLLRMGLKEQTLGARMVWSCTTCYKCQEHCPQNIRVADILYELRNSVAAAKRDNESGNKGDQ